MYSLEIKGLPPSLNNWLSGTHWRTKNKQKDEWHLIFLEAFKRAKLPHPLPEKETPYNIVCTQFCRAKVRDDDNAIIGTKFCKDSLKFYGYVKDDDWKTFNNSVTRTAKGSENKMIIEIT